MSEPSRGATSQAPERDFEARTWLMMPTFPVAGAEPGRSWRECIEPLPGGNRLINATETVAGAIRADFAESDSLYHTGMAFAGVVLLEGVIGPPRAPTLAVLEGIFETKKYIKEYTDSPIIRTLGAATVSIALSTGWCMAASRILNNGVGHFQRFFGVVGKSPHAADKLPKMLPSLQLGRGSLSVPGRTWRSAREVVIAGTVFAPHIYAAGAIGMSAEDRKKLCNRLGWYGGVGMGLSALSIASGAGDMKTAFLATMAIPAVKPASKWAGRKLEKYVPDTIKNAGSRTALLTRQAGRAALGKLEERVPDTVKLHMALGALTTQLAARRGASFAKRKGRQLSSLAFSSSRS